MGGGNKKISSKTSSSVLKMLFLLKIYKNRLITVGESLIDGWHLVTPSLLTTSSAEVTKLYFIVKKFVVHCFVVLYSGEGQVGWTTHADFSSHRLI